MTSESSPTPTPPLSASAPASPPPPPPAAAAIRPVFEPVDTLLSASTAAGGHDDVESPSLTNGRALARFEFEPGRSKDGTKVLMVEWEEDDATKSVVGDWEISWEGKKTVLPARDQPQMTPTSLSSAAAAGDQEQPVNRLYFLLGPGVTIPTAVKLQKAHITWRTSPLPAIFPPELGATARQAGKKGVLHTIWAKKRLQVLQQEIQAESKENVEGIGLEMAAAEKQWIEQNFGVQARPGGLSVSTHPSAMSSVYSSSGSSTTTGNLHSPASPRSPGGGRLMDKLKGLKLGTSPSELASPRTTTTSDAAPLPENYHNPLSPESSDVAVGSFGSFAELKGVPPTTTTTNNTLAAQAPPPPPQQQQPRKMMPQRPPESFAAQQRQQAGGGVGGMGSLNAFTSGDLGMSQSGGVSEDHHDEDDLFALPMSPRSPEMTKSPFSFAVQDTMKYLKEERAL